MEERKYNFKPINGKYLQYFENYEDAERHIDDLIRTYRYHPKPRSISVRGILEDQKKRGIVIPRSSFYYWLKKNNITRRGFKKEIIKKKLYRTFMLEEELVDELNQYPNRTAMVTLALKAVLGLDIADLIVFLDDDIRVIFYFENDNKIKAITTKKLNERDKKFIRSWVQGANLNGMDYIAEQCKLMGFHYIGNKNESSETPPAEWEIHGDDS